MSTAHHPPLVIIEGPDGTGKSTLVTSLYDLYLEQTVPVAYFRDPGSTDIGERLRAMVLDPALPMASITQMFVFLAARAEMLEQAAERLAAGQLVILDRCWISTLAYQGWGQNFGEQIVLDTARFQLENSIDPLTPVTYITLQADHATRIKRLAETGKKPDRFEGKDAEFYRRVDHGYDRGIKLAGDLTHHPTAIHTIDASQHAAEVLRHAVGAINLAAKEWFDAQ